MLKQDGWYEWRQTGSHVQFRHPEKTNTIIVPYHANKDLGKGLAHKLLKEAGLR